MEEVLLQDPGLEEAKFEILDFSSPASEQPRELRVLDAREILRISDERKTEMLSVFAEGYFLAEAELSSTIEAKQERQPSDADSGGQPGLFDGD